MLAMWPATNLPSLSGDSCPSREVDCVCVVFVFIFQYCILAILVVKGFEIY